MFQAAGINAMPNLALPVRCADDFAPGDQARVVLTEVRDTLRGLIFSTDMVTDDDIGAIGANLVAALRALLESSSPAIGAPRALCRAHFDLVASAAQDVEAWTGSLAESLVDRDDAIDGIYAASSALGDVLAFGRAWTPGSGGVIAALRELDAFAQAA